MTEGDNFLDKVLCLLPGRERFDIAPHSNSLEVGLRPGSGNYRGISKTDTIEPQE